MGQHEVLCTASVEDKVPPFMRGTGSGWISAEYSMLQIHAPEDAERHQQRKAQRKGTEIQRLIGRSLRAAVDMAKLGERTIWIDCDVLQANGGRGQPRYPRLCRSFDALRWMSANSLISEIP